MKKEPKQTNRKVNGAIGVRREVAQTFSAFCKKNGFEIAFAAEQALSAWMKAEGRGRV